MDTPTPRQRPAGTVGRTRDPGRDKAILEAALELLSEHGPDATSMESVAARAGVSKSTVYRRWASLTDLFADALDTIRFPQTDAERHANSLRDDLVEGLVGATGCLDERRHRILAAAFESARRDPELVATLFTRFTDAVRAALSDAVTRAIDRGEAVGRRARTIRSDGDAIEFAVAVGLILNLHLFTGRPLKRGDVERIVDEALLPLLTQ